MNPRLRMAWSILSIILFPIYAFTQNGIEHFEKLAQADQKRIIEQINPLPDDSGRATYLNGKVWTASYLDGIVEKVDSVAEITGDLKIKKEHWAYEDLLDPENQVIVKLYYFNQNNQVIERFEYQPERQHSGKTYGLSDTKWEYQYEKGKITKLKTHYCIVDYEQKKNEIIATENDFFGNTSIWTHTNSGNTAISFYKRNDDPERKNYEYKYDEKGRLVYSLYIHGIGKMERFYFFNEEGQLVKWINKDYKTTMEEETLKESVIYSWEYNELGLVEMKNTTIEGNVDFFSSEQFSYSFKFDEQDRLFVEVLKNEENTYGKIDNLITYVFDQHYNWIFRSYENLETDQITEVKARGIKYQEN